MPRTRLISADSHVIEPRNMWVDHVEPAFKARAPRVVKDPPGKKGDYLIIEGVEPQKVGGGFAAGIPPEKLKEQLEAASLDDCIRGAYEPAARMKDMALDGIEAEVIYTTHGFRLFSIPDEALQNAVFKGFNDWLAEFCSYDPKHLIGLGLIPLLNVEDGISELKRCASMGLRGGVIMCSPPEGISYADPRYEPFWAVADELNMPLSLHVLTGHGQESKAEGKFKDNTYLRAMSVVHELQRSFTEIIFGGVLERHPGLKIVSAENDIGWMPHFLYRADHFHSQQKYAKPTDLKMLPSEYAKRQLFVTFMDDPVGVRLADYYGEDNYGWASDYPHMQSTFPNSHKVVDENFADVSKTTKRKITRDNVIKLYNLDLN